MEPVRAAQARTRQDFDPFGPSQAGYNLVEGKLAELSEVLARPHTVKGLDTTYVHKFDQYEAAPLIKTIAVEVLSAWCRDEGLKDLEYEHVTRDAHGNVTDVKRVSFRASSENSGTGARKVFSREAVEAARKVIGVTRWDTGEDGYFQFSRTPDEQGSRLMGIRSDVYTLLTRARADMAVSLELEEARQQHAGAKAASRARFADPFGDNPASPLQGGSAAPLAPKAEEIRQQRFVKWFRDTIAKAASGPAVGKHTVSDEARINDNVPPRSSRFDL